MRKVLKIIMIILLSLVVLVALLYGFTKVWPSFGANPSDAKKQEYQKLSKNFDGKIFHNEYAFEIMADVPEGMQEDNISTKGTTPKDMLPADKPSFLHSPKEEDVSVTWLGHSTLLLQMHQLNILFDPVFSDRTSPVSFVGNKRFSQLPITTEELPELDVVIFTHDHYDHLDYDTVKAIDSKVKFYIVPLGVENHLQRWGVAKEKIKYVTWWDEVNVAGLTVACTPARHFSGRHLDNRYSTQWAGFVLKDEHHTIFESGDTGYDKHFIDIARKYGPFDFVMLDCAQYNLRWPSVHMHPEEAYQAALDLQAKVVMPIHWGAFSLSKHPWDDSVRRFLRADKENKPLTVTPKLGETMLFEKLADYQERWYEALE